MYQKGIDFLFCLSIKAMLALKNKLCSYLYLSVLPESESDPIRLAPLSMGFSRQKYWSGWPFPSAEDLPDPGIESVSPSLVSEPVFLLCLFHVICGCMTM